MTYEYLSTTNEYYSTIKLSSLQYSEPYPNPEEAERYAAIGVYLSLLRQEYVKRDKVPRILDLGCGRGWLTNMMSPFGSCQGIEPAPGAIRLAERLFPSITFHVGTLDELIGSPGFEPFDIIVSSEVIEHVPKHLKSQFVENIRQGLPTGGYCIITTPRGELHRKWLQSGEPQQPIEDWLTEKELKNEFEAAGFKVLHHTRVRNASFLRLSHIARDWRVRRMLDILGLRFLLPAVDYLSSFYQVWLFEK